MPTAEIQATAVDRALDPELAQTAAADALRALPLCGERDDVARSW